MGAIMSVAGDAVWMSTGSAEAIRHGLVACLRESGADGTPLGARAIEALEMMWPAGLGDDDAPWSEPEVHDLLAPAWLALALDVALPEPRLAVREVNWSRIDRVGRIHWIARLIRLSRAWTGTDLTGELSRGWPEPERAVLEVWLAETAISRAWRRFHGAPSPEHRAALESALSAQADLARALEPAIADPILDRHARTRRRADELTSSRTR